MNIELLAPAKNKETAFAAIDCGADAVYMGAPSFSARRNAPNSLDDIKEVVDYAHKYWAKVHIALNTILTDEELDEAIGIVLELEKIGVDALIIQDMGILNKLIELINSDKLHLPLHMSTQCDNYLPQKVKFFNEIGVSRVILARELSIEQISNIHNENPDLELESFIHGALCVSMSGQCYLSQYIGGRSANRGECAQPCRKKYSVETSDGKVLAKDVYPLCLKDFNGSKYINELQNAGICSFKIEGRLKDVGYVKNITAYYRSILGKGISSGKNIHPYPFTPNPEKSFNRGFTTYFLNGREKCFSFESPKSRGEYIGKVISAETDNITIKTNKNIYPQDGLYFDNDGCLVNKAVKENENLLKIYPNKKINISIGTDIYRNYDVQFEKDLLKPVKRQIGVGVNFSDLNGGAIVTLTDEDGVTVSGEIKGEKSNNPESMKETFVKQISKTGEEDFYIQNIEIKSEVPFMPISSINQVRRELFEELMAKRVEVYNTKIKQVQKPLTYTEYFIKEVDYRANVHNSSAKSLYEKCGCKVLEPSFETKLPQRQIELMRCKHCIKYALNMCKSPVNLVLKDGYGKTYPLKFNCEKCEMSVMN